ncbi:MAG: hypothetical protein WC699_10030 [Bacteroidales bacterium]|jgi:hypothetical protein
MRNWKIVLVVVLAFSGGVMAGQGQPKKFYFPAIDWKTGWAGGLKAGTFGPGIECIKSINPNWNARLGFSLLPFTLNRQLSVGNLGLDIKARNRLSGVNLQGDFFFKPWFYFTGGLMVDLVQSNLKINLTDTVLYGDIRITPDQVGELTVIVRPGWRVAPFVGIGFGHALPVIRRLSFNIELGAIYHGKPRISLDASGMINPTASAENEIALETLFKGYRFYPLLSMQLNYRFR